MENGRQIAAPALSAIIKICSVLTLSVTSKGKAKLVLLIDTVFTKKRVCSEMLHTRFFIMRS